MRTYLDIDSFSEWSKEEKDTFSIRVLKGIILDGVRKANSGHSGGPLSSIDFAYSLFTEFLNFRVMKPRTSQTCFLKFQNKVPSFPIEYCTSC